MRRSGAFAALCTLVLVLPLFGHTAAAIVAGVVLVLAFVVTDGPIFDLFAFPLDYEDERLYGVVSFVLAAIALGVVEVTTTMTMPIVVGSVLLIGYGNLAEQYARTKRDVAVYRVGAFVVVGTFAGTVGQGLSIVLADLAVTVDAGVAVDVGDALPVLLFLATSGALLAAILRDVLIRYDDPVVMLFVGVLLWLLAELDPAVGGFELAVAIAVTVAFGYASFVLGAASVAGMLTGILLGLLTIVLGGYGWFVVLLAFFGLGSLSTKFRYEEKAARGIAEDNDGARGSANVLSNAAVALGAVLGYAASASTLVAVEPELFLLAFAGAVATALSDTLSSEIGGVFDGPRLITTLEPVEPGTDGGITWQGELAGIAGAAIVAGLSFVLFDAVGPTEALVIVAAGFVGMTVDSLLGATLEGSLLGNQGVNFLATLAGALFCAFAVGSPALVG